MNELQEITDYSRSMKIKKTIFGGYEREDVFVKMGELTSMFQRYIDELRKEEQEKQKHFLHFFVIQRTVPLIFSIRPRSELC